MGYKKAFTIIELLIIIVLIGILSVITVVSYTNISQKAITATLQSDLVNAKKQIMNFQIQNASNLFPTSISTCPVIDTSTQLCIKPSGSNVLTYTAYNSTDQPSFYLTGTNSGIIYHVADNTEVSEKSVPSTNGLDYSLDFANSTSYTGSGSITTDLVNGLSGSLVNSSYYSYDNATKSMNFTRDTATVIGGYHTATMTGKLAASSFFYNNHSMEVLAKINDYSASNINANETDNSLMVYQGYHSGFRYTASGLIYGFWNGVTNPVVNFSSSPTVGTWFHAVAVRIGNSTKVYLNGVLSASLNHSSSLGNPGTTNIFKFGSGNPGTGPYASYCKCNIAFGKLYSRALSAAEVAQNFDAARGRYGI